MRWQCLTFGVLTYNMSMSECCIFTVSTSHPLEWACTSTRVGMHTSPRMTRRHHHHPARNCLRQSRWSFPTQLFLLKLASLMGQQGVHILRSLHIHYTSTQSTVYSPAPSAFSWRPLPWPDAWPSCTACCELLTERVANADDMVHVHAGGKCTHACVWRCRRVTSWTTVLTNT